ncbi:MAG TPA: bifunctional precorrin-2 dehydrogenase/sirohydrochlorin ferrochelatase [Paludibaculum sp.]|jgi:siroheme synthase-like protein
MPQGYPIILNLTGARVLVLGEGREAEEKSAALAECGAVVERRPDYEPGTISGYLLVIAASPDRSRNGEIFAEAERLGVLINCIDDPPHCRFTFASIVRRGELLIAISTGGACPALAVRLREQMEREYGPEYEEFLVMARGLREKLAEAVPDFQQRRRVWYAMVDGFLREQG